MKIVYIAAELVPFAKTGGLADVAGTLPVEIHHLGHEVIAILPRYKQVNVEKNDLQLELDSLDVPNAAGKMKTRVFSCLQKNGLKVYFIDQLDYFDRDGIYGTAQGDFPDNDRRFIFFQRAALELLKQLKFKPDVIHCHDWQTGLIPVYLKTLYLNDSNFKKTKTVFTIHNLAYQGNFPPDTLPTTGLDWGQFTKERLEFYGKVSFLKGGVLDADALTTVSQRYAQEIQTKEFGHGFEGIFASRGDKLSGIVNGIDPAEWNPSEDKELVAKFSASQLEGKNANKAALQKENSFEVNPNALLVGVITRLVDQKGMDILIPALPEMMDMGIQFVLLGTGEEKYHHLLRELAKNFHGQCGSHIIFDAKMAKRIYAGSDMFLVPSYYEPCGLSQMIALRFGTIPIVRETGGLADTIEEFDPGKGTGNGFLFQEYSSEALVSSLKKAINLYEKQAIWAKLVQNAFACDFSWNASAKKYVELYQSTRRREVKNTKK